MIGEMSKKKKSSSEDAYNDFGILSLEESQMQQSKLINQQQRSIRIIICGDSGIGKTSMANAFIPKKTTEKKLSLEPIEVHDSNLCVVDTCGYGALLRADVIFSHVKNYIEGQFEKTNQIFNPNSQNSDTLVNVINQASDAFTHLDFCLYVIMGRMKPVDIEYMRTIHDLVNIIPVIIQTDISQKLEMVIDQRIDILNMMKENNIKFNYLGYSDFDALVSACRQPHLNPYCPPFTLDWSSTKKSFHGLISLKQALFQQNLSSLRYETTLKFIQWRKQQQELSASTSSSSNSSNSSSSLLKSQNLNSIRISQYVSHRRHSMEKEILSQEKKLRQELDTAALQQKTEIITREINKLMLQNNHHSLIKSIQQLQLQQQLRDPQRKQKEEQQQQQQIYFIIGSISLSFLLVTVVYCLILK